MNGRCHLFVYDKSDIDDSYMIHLCEITTATEKFCKSRACLENKTPKHPVSQNEHGSPKRLASASSFKSKIERRRTGRKYGWNSYISWIFFIQTFLFIYASADVEPCALGLKTPGRTWPQGDIVLEYGQPLRIYCILNEDLTNPKLRGRNASHLAFFRRDALVEPEYLTVVNVTTIMMHVEQPVPSNDMYYCKLKLNDSHRRQQYEAVCLNSVVIGFKPKVPLSFSCTSQNWQKLVCTWEPAPNYIKTKFSLAFRLQGRISRWLLLCPRPLGESNVPPNTCVWDLSTYPHYRQLYEYFTFELTAENVLGTSIFTYEFHHWAHVVPSRPNDLSVVNKTSSSVLLYWRVPFPMEIFPPGLYHRVSYQNQQDSQETWKSVDIMDQKHSKEMYFNLTDLQHANSAYTVRISLRSSVAADESRWGQFSEVFFKTVPTSPSLPPKTDVGSFEIAGNSNSRDVYIYWQGIPQYLENGDNFTYQIVCIKENGQSLDLQPHEITKTYAKFEGVSLNSLTFDIVAANCEGVSKEKATVRIPSQLEMPQKPVVFTKIAFDGHIYELSWNSSGSSNIVDYTIFWCENERDRPYQCSGYLDWVHVPQHTCIYNITVPNSKKVYQFAIAANTAQASSGMAWISSMTTLNNVVGKLKSVWITHIESELIQVKWELEYSGRIGIIEGFKIYYCPIVSANNLTCNGPKMIATVTPAPHTLHGVIRNLIPETTYSITVAIMTNNGEGLQSDALYAMTLKTTLDLVSESSKLIDTLPDPAVALPDVNMSTEIGGRLFMMNDFAKEIKQNCNGDDDCRPDQIEQLNFDSAACLGQISKLTQTISACEKKLAFLSDKNRKLRDASILKCNEVW